MLEAYGLEQGGSLVGLQFAFETLDYAREVAANVAAFREQTGVRPAMVGAYFDFKSRPRDLSAFLAAARAEGCVPSVTLDPKDYANPDTRAQKDYLARIVKGDFDADLSGWAQALRDFGRPVLLRFAHEMNGDWYPYGGGGDGNGDGRADGPEAYIRAWRHAHDRFAAEGADKALWVFCPNGEDFPDRDWNRPFRYYPGDAYADLVSVDAYEHHEKRTRSLAEAMDHFLAEMGAFLRERESAAGASLPAFGLGEFGTNRARAAAKAYWYVDALRGIGGDPRIQFHFVYNGRDKGQDYSLTGLRKRLGDAYRQASFRFGLTGAAMP